MSNVGIVFPASKVEKIVGAVSHQLDKYTLQPLSSIDDVQNFVLQTQMEFDRLVMHEYIFSHADPSFQSQPIEPNNPSDPRISAVQKLYSFLDDNRHSLEVVVFCSSVENTNFANYFQDEVDFESTTAFVADKVSVPRVIDMVRLPIVELNAKHSIPRAKSKMIIASILDDSTTDVTPSNTPKSNKKQKKGIFGSLFGSKKSPGQPQSSSKSTATVEELSRKVGMQSFEQERQEALARPSEVGFSTTPAPMQVDTPQVNFADTPDFSAPTTPSIEGINFESMVLDDDGSSETGFLSDDDDDPYGLPDSTPAPQTEQVDNQYAQYDQQYAQYETPAPDSSPYGYLDESAEPLGNATPNPAYPDQPYTDQYSQYDQPEQGYSDQYSQYDQPEQGYSDQYSQYDQPDQSPSHEPTPSPGYQAPAVAPSAVVVPSSVDDDSLMVDVRERIVVVAGVNSSLTTEVAIGTTVASLDKGKVLFIDLDFEKSPSLAFLDDVVGFHTSGAHHVGATPYTEDDIDFYINSLGVSPDSEKWLSWVSDSRNYAQYSRIIISTPISRLSGIKSLLPTTHTALIIPGNTAGMISLVQELSVRYRVDDATVAVLNDVARVYPQRKEESFVSDFNTLRKGCVIDRVDWFSKVEGI